MWPEEAKSMLQDCSDSTDWDTVKTRHTQGQICNSSDKEHQEMHHSCCSLNQNNRNTAKPLTVDEQRCDHGVTLKAI